MTVCIAGTRHLVSYRSSAGLTRALTPVVFGNIFPNMETQTSTILLALARLLRPIVRVLLHNKVSYATFDEIARQVFVEVADEHFAIDGKKQTNSRIAVVTGLSRKEVLRIKRLEPLADRDLGKQFHRAARVVSAWTSEERFMDSDSKPAVLPFDGADNSFSALVASHSGDMPPRAILDDLTQAGVVSIDDDRNVRLLKTAYVPSQDAAQIMRILGTDVGDLGETIVHNLHASDRDSRFQLKVAYDNLPEEALNDFHDMVSQRGYSVLKDFDQWLRQHDRDSNPDASGSGRMRAGVGIYYFEEQQEA